MDELRFDFPKKKIYESVNLLYKNCNYTSSNRTMVACQRHSLESRGIYRAERDTKKYQNSVCGRSSEIVQPDVQN